MRRYFFTLYSVLSYVLFLGVFAYLIGFTGNMVVPKSVDSGDESGLAGALILNVALIGLFGVQHSVMARQSFKRLSARHMPKPIERSTYVLFTNLVLIALYVLWQPITATVWDVQIWAGKVLLYTLFGMGWATVVLVSFLINHFELFGLQQAYFNLKNTQAPNIRFMTPLLYKIVRHPMQTGMAMGLWAIPHMTVGHLLFAAGMTIYILIGLHYEERDLVSTFGKDYVDYQGRVPKLAPIRTNRDSRRRTPRTTLLSTQEMIISYIHLRR
jgi:protein-S-isoprenylcysteine O-methyltransferase Ste14